MKDCDPAAPRGALKLIKCTRTFTQHLEREDENKQSNMLLSIKHLFCVFHGFVYVPFLSFCFSHSSIFSVLEHVQRLRENVELDILKYFLVCVYLHTFQIIPDHSLLCIVWSPMFEWI